MPSRLTIGVAAVASVVALAACTNSSDTTPGGAGDVPAGSVVISSDLPLQGPAAAASESTNNMISLYLEQEGNLAGEYPIEFRTYDDSTEEKGTWDDAACARNAQLHVSDPDEIAVVGPYDSGCAKIIAPVLNQDPDGPMLMVSHASTNPGLTKAWAPGEPEIYYPTGDRNFARVVTTDDNQGAAAAQFMAKDLKVKKCFVINDRETYGQGIAKAFADEAAERDIEILGNEPWDADQDDYAELFELIKTSKPDCLYIAGTYGSNGGQLIRDKVEFLGDNEEVITMAPDGFSGYPEFQEQPEAQGVYLTFAGQDLGSLTEEGGLAAALTKAYEEKFGEPPVSSSGLYAVAATQVILEAIAQSDGTRQGVTEAVLGGKGITIPAEESVLGKEITIDPETGDIDNKDVTVLLMEDGQESLVGPWRVR